MTWEYEPHTFVFTRGADGHPTWAFAPDFWLPEHRRYIEVTTMNQRLITRKNRKIRQLRQMHPDIDITLLCQRDYHALHLKYGLEQPEQDASSTVA